MRAPRVDRTVRADRGRKATKSHVRNRRVRRQEGRCAHPDGRVQAALMLKEIHEQPRALATTMRALADPDGALGLDREELQRIDRIAMVACGTSWHAALVGK